jgi:hypothetical protein
MVTKAITEAESLVSSLNLVTFIADSTVKKSRTTSPYMLMNGIIKLAKYKTETIANKF